MNKKSTTSHLAVALGTTFAVTVAASPLADAAENPFAATSFDTGYMVAEGKGAEGKCGESKGKSGKAAEGKCGEGKCGEGKCGGKS